MKLIDYAGILSIVLLCSCGKESIEQEPANVFPDPSNSDNIEIFNERIYSPAEFCDFIGNSCSDYINVYLTEDANAVFKLVAAQAVEKNRGAVDRQVAKENRTIELLARTMWSVKKIDYSYWTASTQGKPIQLSAALVVPVLNNSRVSHTLSAISLCPPHGANSAEACPTKLGTILMARVAFNHAVVVPDYEGRGITPQLGYAPIENRIQARQAIDAELAALTILKEEGYTWGEGFGTYNVGISGGCGVSYYSQYMIENVIPQEQRDRINLISTFAADGLIYLGTHLDTMFSTDMSNEGMLQGVMSQFCPVIANLPESEKCGYKPEDLLSTAILDDNNKVNVNHPLIQILRKELIKNDINFNWEPKHPITFEGSYNDTSITPEYQIIGAYNLLRNRQDGMPNRNVKLHMFETPVTSMIANEIIGGDYAPLFPHLMADFISFVRGIENLDPSIVD